MKSEEVCEHCESMMVYPWASKSQKERLMKNRVFCVNCNHSRTPQCICEYCKEAREIASKEELERKREVLEHKKSVIKRHFDEEHFVPLAEESLSLEDRVFLAVVLRASLAESTNYVEPLGSAYGELAPTDYFEIEIIRTLVARKVLIPHVNSSLDAFEIHEDGEKIRYQIYDVKYRINILPYDSDYDAMIKRLMYPDSALFYDNKEFCLEIWQKISLNESLQYLLYQMNKVGYSFNPGAKTIRVFEYLLEHFATSQIYNIIYRAVANSTTRYQSGEVTKRHAQNSVITSCEKQGERAIAEGWALKGYNRIKDLPETIISEVFFTSILKIAYLGFSEKPTMEF